MKSRLIVLGAVMAALFLVGFAYYTGYDRAAPVRPVFKNAQLYQGDPTLDVANYAKQHPGEKWAQQLKDIPRAHWLADDPSVNTLPQWLQGVDAQHALPVLVLFRIPNRFCEGSGRRVTADKYPLEPGAYDVWIQRVIAQLGSHKAVIIYEPNALIRCYDHQRRDTMKLAISKLAAAGQYVYIDAGNPGAISLKEAARRLEEVGVEKTQGFALNFANFYPTREIGKFGDDLSNKLNDRHYVIDTSRNARQPAVRSGSNWFCNPPDMGIGQRPTTNTGNSRVDALLWVKNPELSDGSCHDGDPPQGDIFPAQAKRLVDTANPPF